MLLHLGLLLHLGPVIALVPSTTPSTPLPQPAGRDDQGCCTDFDFVLSAFCRRLYCVASFFFFFLDILVGAVSCSLLLMGGIVLGVLFLPRLDRSSLMRGYQIWDQGTHDSPDPTTLITVGRGGQKGRENHCRIGSEAKKKICWKAVPT